MITLKSIRGAFCLALGLALAIFFEKQGLKADHFITIWAHRFSQAFEDPDTQWLFVVFCVSYFVVLSALFRPSQKSAILGWTLGELWIAGLLLGVLIPYASNYSNASQSTDALIVVAGLCIGRATIVVAQLITRSGYASMQAIVLALLMVFLVAACLGHGQSGDVYHYQGQPRWTGPWRNPNTCGLLMGVGFALSLGLLLRGRRPKSAVLEERLETIVILAAIVIFGICLTITFSRGAWVGTFCAVIYLCIKRLSSSTISIVPGRERMHRNGLICCILVVGIGVAGWSGTRLLTPDSRLEKRLQSFTNINDFSWRNRVSTWVGMLQMISDRPVSGFGWKEMEGSYIDYYRPVGLNDGLAVRVNNYLGAAASAGIALLACLVGYICISWPGNRHPSDLKVKSGTFWGREDWLLVVVQAGAIVFVVGFWFDGGLFQMATAVPFWLLLQMHALRSKGVGEKEIGGKDSRPSAGIVAELSDSAKALKNYYMRWPKTLRVVITIPAVLIGICLILPPLQILFARFHSPAKTVAVHGTNISARAHLSEVSSDFLTCVWVSEDRRFFTHSGFDWEEIRNAREEAKRTGKPPRGASTITQQCARSLYLWQGRSWIRKGLEAYYSIWMELLLSKVRILELYVNVIELGDGIYGIEAASQHYYGVSSAELTREQAAMLVAIMPNPKQWDPLNPNERVQRRQAMILQRTEHAKFPLSLEEKR
ncbi:MAG: monofunctional biosynthetic peptidoglycan transglycosylase [Verrucomicrobia bacterium]|nr:monofunctional biosynthetic peptidoglycan transglycosylase [Verrucomicrobiota bacterium]